MPETIGYAPPEVHIQPHLSTTTTEAVPPIIYANGIKHPEDRGFTEQAIHTAGHELNHALVALDYGYLPDAIEVGKKGNSLGRTLFTGEIPDDVFAIIAGGGAVDTAFGQARGYGSIHHHGSDYGHIGEIAGHGQNVESYINEAVSKARTSISRMVPDKDVLKRAAAIIADMKYVPGRMLGEIIRISELEVKHGVGEIGSFVTETMNTIKQSKAYENAVRSGIKTAIDIDEHGVPHKKVIVMDPDDTEKNLCPLCHEFGGHERSCMMLKQKPNRSNETTKGGTALQNGGTIFEGTQLTTTSVGIVG